MKKKKAITRILSIVSSGLNLAQEWPPLELTVSHKSYKSGDCGADEAARVRDRGKMAAHSCTNVFVRP